MTIYTAPTSFQVTYDPGNDEAVSAITFYVTMLDSPITFSGFCTTANGLGSAVAGAIESEFAGPAGAAFGLAGLICGGI